MTSIVLSTDVPTNINTLERHLAWSALSLALINPNASVLEQQNNNQLAAQAAIFYAADKTYRLLVRACLEIDPAFMNDRTKKLWMHTRDMSGTVLPADFKTN